MDAMLCSLPAAAAKGQTVRSHSLSVWLGVVIIMGKVIEFYVPESFRRKSGRWIPTHSLGKLIPFQVPQRTLAQGPRFLADWFAAKGI